MRRITKTAKRELITAVINHKTSDTLDGHAQAMRDMADVVYDAIVPPDVQAQLRKLPPEFLKYRRSIPLQVAGEDMTINYSPPRAFPTGKDIVIPDDMLELLLDAYQRLKTFEIQQATMISVIEDALSSVSTYDKLASVWPTCRDFMDNPVALVGDAIDDYISQSSVAFDPEQRI